MELLPKAYDATAAALATVTAWDAPSPCTDWTVRDVTAHLVDALRFFAATVDDGPTGDSLGDDPLGAFRGAADRCLAVFSRPDVLAASHPFPFGPTPGLVIAQISLSESLVHGWDIARGAGVPYSPPRVPRSRIPSSGFVHTACCARTRSSVCLNAGLADARSRAASVRTTVSRSWSPVGMPDGFSNSSGFAKTAAP
jgi:uncharacterized protein (TIGR03086 family)